MDQYPVRNFRAGDEVEVAKLFNEVYGEYGGFVPRTVEYWRWCCLERPDVEENGVFLVTDGENGSLVGYVVAGSSGNIWELCAGGNRKQVALALLREAVKYLNGLGVSSVNVNVPRDRMLGEAFAEAGFSEIPSERMFVSALSARELFSALAADARSAGNLDEDMIVELDRSPFGVENVVSVKVHGGQAEVQDGRLACSSMLARMDFSALLSVFFKDTGPYRAFFRGKVRVKPFRKTRKFLKFLSALQLNASWFFPLSDYG